MLLQRALPLVLLLPAMAAAQAPPGYYASVNDTSPGALRSSLHAVIDDHQRFPYTSGGTDTWDILKKADQDPGNSGKVLDVYRNASFTKVSGGSGSYNREHTWPNSYGFPSDSGTNYPYTDCHQLFLCDIGYNGDRGSKLFGDGNGSWNEHTTLFNDGAGGGSGIFPGNSNWSHDGNDRYQVWAGRKGDVARALLYLDVRYEGGNHGGTGASEPDLILTDNAALVYGSQTGSNESVAYMGMLSTLLAWHAADPVDAKELARNDEVYNYQGNRNPFIDHPEWVDCLFNGGCGVDTTPPAIPSGLVASSGAALVSLDWGDNGESDFAGYRIYRSLLPGGPYEELGVGLVGTSALLDAGLTAGAGYHYVVAAEDQTGNLSAQTAEVSAVPSAGGAGGSGTPWINELHYDNGGGDVGEFVEVAGPAGLDLSGYELVGYNGNGGVTYHTEPLTGTLADQGGCVGSLAFAIAGLQNGGPDGLALVAPGGAVLQFLSYEGSFAAANGPALGLTSVDIGVLEDSSTTSGQSLQLTGSGAASGDFTWQAPQAETPGGPNAGQAFVGGCTSACGAAVYDIGASPVNTIALAASGSLAPGTFVDLEAGNVPGFGSFYGVSAGKSFLPLLGGTVLVDPFQLLLPLTFKASLTGSTVWSVPIPTDPAFAGLAVYAQVFALDGTQPGGYSLSGGLELIVCP